MSDKQRTGPEAGDPAPGTAATRRALLRIGAVAIPAVITLKPAFATGLAASALNCRIPLTGRVNAEGIVNGSGTLHNPPGIGYYTGKQYKLNQRPSGVSDSAKLAHRKYIEKLTRGTPGFTCFASVKRF